MKTKAILIILATVTLAACSTSEKYQYVWKKDNLIPESTQEAKYGPLYKESHDSSPQEAQEAATACGNSIGENTIDTVERQDSFHECMRGYGYKLHRLKKQ